MLRRSKFSSLQLVGVHHVLALHLTKAYVLLDTMFYGAWILKDIKKHPHNAYGILRCECFFLPSFYSVELSLYMVTLMPLKCEGVVEEVKHL